MLKQNVWRNWYFIWNLAWMCNKLKLKLLNEPVWLIINIYSKSQPNIKQMQNWASQFTSLTARLEAWHCLTPVSLQNWLLADLLLVTPLIFLLCHHPLESLHFWHNRGHRPAWFTLFPLLQTANTSWWCNHQHSLTCVTWRVIQLQD